MALERMDEDSLLTEGSDYEVISDEEEQDDEQDEPKRKVRFVGLEPPVRAAAIQSLLRCGSRLHTVASA